MEKKVYRPVGKKKREFILSRIKNALKKRPEVSFAYIHGSFPKGGSFKDVDVAVYLEKLPRSVLNYELGMEEELADITGCEVDARVLNVSPLSFKYNVIKDGEMLFARDDEERVDFYEATLVNYFDFAPYRHIYLKETLGHGI